ncbi:MAG: hypothetical protein WAS33_24990 [Candidatus Promineifilaceae bacterium]
MDELNTFRVMPWLSSHPLQKLLTLSGFIHRLNQKQMNTRMSGKSLVAQVITGWAQMGKARIPHAVNGTARRQTFSFFVPGGDIFVGRLAHFYLAKNTHRPYQAF